MGWVFGAAVAGIAVYAAVQLFRYRGNRNWPTVEGTIEGTPEIHAWGAESHSYYAVLFYSYSAGGERYPGSWQSPSKPKRQQVIDLIAAKLPPQTKITIRYNPKKPAMSLADIDPLIFNEDEIIRLGL